MTKKHEKKHQPKLRVSPYLRDLLKTMKDHPWQRRCPACAKDCGAIALVDLIYCFQTCDCKYAPYVHLVEHVYHRKCFAGAEPNRGGSHDKT